MSTYSQIDVDDNCTGSINNVGNTFVNCSTPVFNWFTLQPNGKGKTKPKKFEVKQLISKYMAPGAQEIGFQMVGNYFGRLRRLDICPLPADCSAIIN